MGQSNNHNFSVETQFEVVTRAGKLPNTLLHKTPSQFAASDEYELAKIFDGLVNDPQFKTWLKKSVDRIDDREELNREREETQPSLFDAVVDIGIGVCIAEAVGFMQSGGDEDSGETPTPSSDEPWPGDGGEFDGAGASGDFGGSDDN